MKARKFAFLLMIFLIPLYTFYSTAYACTIFVQQLDDKVLAGNNEDWMYSVPSSMWFAGRGEDSFGRVCFANMSYVQGGMNEYGLFYDGATCPTSEVPHFDGKPSLGMDLGEVVLSKCRNVKEAVEMLKNYNIPQSFTDHLLFADETGDSAVIEWVKGEMKVIPKEGAYQLVTNFWLSYPELGWYPCSRYDTAKAMLDKENELSVEGLTEVLKATAQNWGDGGTRYSNIYDLKSKTVYVYYKGDFTASKKFSLTDELKKIESGNTQTLSLDELFLAQGGAEPASASAAAEADAVCTNIETALTGKTVEAASTNETPERHAIPASAILAVIPALMIIGCGLLFITRPRRK